MIAVWSSTTSHVTHRGQRAILIAQGITQHPAYVDALLDDMPCNSCSSWRSNRVPLHSTGTIASPPSRSHSQQRDGDDETWTCRRRRFLSVPAVQNGRRQSTPPLHNAPPPPTTDETVARNIDFSVADILNWLRPSVGPSVHRHDAIAGHVLRRSFIHTFSPLILH